MIINTKTHIAKIKLTELGQQIAEQMQVSKIAKDLDENGFSIWYFWELISVFGAGFYKESREIFEADIILIDESITIEDLEEYRRETIIIPPKSTRPNLVALASWKCGCTIFAKTILDIHIPRRCPEHNLEFLDKPIWQENRNNIPLGITKAESSEGIGTSQYAEVDQDLLRALKDSVKISKPKTSRPNLLEWD